MSKIIHFQDSKNNINVNLEWQNEVTDSKFNQMPARLAYGLFKENHEKSGRVKPFADSLLYSGSMMYTIYEANNTIRGPKGPIRTRRKLPNLPYMFQPQDHCEDWNAFVLQTLIHSMYPI